MSGFLSRFRHLAATAQAAEDEEQPEEREAAAEEQEEEEAAAEEEREEPRAEDEEEDPALEEDEEESASARAARRVERARCAAILGAAEAAGRVPMACSLAFETDLSPKAARKILAAAPREAAQAQAGGGLSAAMRSVKQPSLGPGEAAAAATDEAALAAQVISVHRGQRRSAGKEG